MQQIATTQTQIIIEQRVVVRDMSWETYERIMAEQADHSAPRFTYDNGTLEIYMPTQKHETLSRICEIFVSAIAEELELDILSLGSTTFRKEKVSKGVEPDGCFYLQSFEKVADIEKIDLEIHPPPDLVVEIDVTSPSLDRFSIYAAFGVPEIWRYSKNEVKIFRLIGDNYVETAESVEINQVTAEILTKFLNEGLKQKRSIWLKNVREWIRNES